MARPRCLLAALSLALLPRLAFCQESLSDGGGSAETWRALRGATAKASSNASDASEMAFVAGGCGDRWTRLKHYGTTKLYHQTSEEAGKSILKEGFDPSDTTHHSAGMATYFALDLESTNVKTHHHGFCIEAQVYLGNTKKLPRKFYGRESQSSLIRDCYDSTYTEGWHGGPQYAVYAKDQMPKELYKRVECVRS